MEPYIKDVSDITYKSELIPHPASKLNSYCFLGEGLIRRRPRRSVGATTYVVLRHKSSAH